MDVPGAENLCLYYKLIHINVILFKYYIKTETSFETEMGFAKNLYFWKNLSLFQMPKFQHTST